MRLNNDDFSTLTFRYFDRIFAYSTNKIKSCDVITRYCSKNPFMDKYGIQRKYELVPRIIKNTKISFNE